MFCEIEKVKLTISAHSCSHTLLQPTILASVAIDPEYCALLVLCAWPIVNSLLDRPAEEALKAKVN